MQTKVFAFLILSLSLYACEKNTLTPSQPETSVQKKVIFSISAAQEYTAPQYSSIHATLSLTVGTIAGTSGDFTRIWDTTINRPLTDFPALPLSIQIEKTFTVKSTSEQLQVANSIRYNNNGLLSQKARFEPVPRGLFVFAYPVLL